MVERKRRCCVPNGAASTGEYEDMVKTAPNIRSIRPDGDRRLMNTWKGGAESIVDVSKLLADYAIFKPLRDDDNLFRKVIVGEWGWCSHWSDDLEISSDMLWRLALERGSSLRS
jgi:hypothetical protein